MGKTDFDKCLIIVNQEGETIAITRVFETIFYMRWRIESIDRIAVVRRNLKEVVDGGSPMSPIIAARVVNLFRTFRPPESADYRLTPQEISLLKLLVEGHCKKTAAREMGISIHTVSFHLKNIHCKLQVHSKTEAVAKALRERLV